MSVINFTDRGPAAEFGWKVKIKENKDNGCNLVIYLDLAKIDKYQNMDPKGHGEQQSQAQAENELKGALR